MRAAMRGRAPAAQSLANGIRGCRSPPAPASTAAASCWRRRRDACRSTAPGGWARRTGCSATGSLRRPTLQGPASPVLVSHLPRRRDRCAVGAGPDRGPAVPQAAPDAGGVARLTGAPFAEDPRLQLAPGGGGVRRAAQRRQGDRVPGHRLHATRTCRTSPRRHYWEVGATDTRVDDRLAGPLPRPVVGDRRQPAPGPLDGRRDEPDAGHRGQPGGGDRPARELLAVAATDVWGDVFDLDARLRLGARRRPAPSAPIPRSPRSRAPHRRWGSCAAPWRRSATPDGNAEPTPSPVTYPTSSTSDFPQRLAGLAAMIAAGLPLRCVALTPDTQFDTHATQSETFTPGLTTIAEADRRVPGRPRGPRDRRPRARPRVVGVRPPGAGERSGSAPITAPRASSHADRHARHRRRWWGSGPVADQPRRQRQPERERRLPRRVRSLLEQWFDHDAGVGDPRRAHSSPATS